jgi:Zn-dependent protease
MFLGEPPPTQADLHFRVFGFPVRVHPYFWVVSLLMGMGGFRSGKADPTVVLIWVVVVFISILIHELGHAFLQRSFGGHPWITLYSFGGLASCRECDRSPRAQIIISLAGPVAGFILAGFIVAVLHGLGRVQGFERSLMPVRWIPFGPDRFAVNVFVFDMLYVNILWGLVNLLPIYPLDGGQIARELFTLANPRQGIIQSLQLSIGVAALVAAYGLTKQDWFLCLMFGFLAYGNYQALAMYRNHWR